MGLYFSHRGCADDDRGSLDKICWKLIAAAQPSQKGPIEPSHSFSFGQFDGGVGHASEAFLDDLSLNGSGSTAALVTVRE